jgi:hypothetical protein
MSINRITGAFRLLAYSLLICAAVVHGPRTSFAQSANSVNGRKTRNRPPARPDFQSRHWKINNNHARKRPAKIRDAVSAGFSAKPGLKPRNSGTD